MKRCLWLTLLVVVAAAAGQEKKATPRLVAHRGLLEHAPENTLANFRACLELGLGFEFDVRATRDGQLVCVHDATVNRTTSGTGKVAELSLADIKKLDAGLWFDPAFAGQRVPTIDEILQLLKASGRGDVLLAADLKVDDAGVPEEVVRLARKHSVLGQVLFIGLAINDAKIRGRLRGVDAQAAVAVLAQTPKDLDAALASADADWIYTRFVPSEEEAARIRKAKRKLFISGPVVARRAAENWQKARVIGADGMLTDQPLDVRLLWRGATPE